MNIIKVNIYYSGSKNELIESKINSIADQTGGNKSGDWGFFEKGFQCLFVFKKDYSFDLFKNELKRNLGISYSKIMISRGQ